MERNIREPFTWAKHPQLLERINETIIGIKVHHNVNYKDYPTRESLKKVQEGHSMPTMEQVMELLKECYNAINEQREDPRKY